MSHPKTGRLTPVLAVLLAGGALASMAFLPEWLPVVAVAAVALLGGAAVASRRSRGIFLAIAAAVVLLAIGLAGAWLLHTSPTGGLAWTLLVLFALPLPLVPLLYWLTFEAGESKEGRGESYGPDRTGSRATAERGRPQSHMTANHDLPKDSPPSPHSPLPSHHSAGTATHPGLSRARH
jgi:hypothetical protein